MISPTLAPIVSRFLRDRSSALTAITALRLALADLRALTPNGSLDAETARILSAMRVEADELYDALAPIDPDWLCTLLQNLQQIEQSPKAQVIPIATARSKKDR